MSHEARGGDRLAKVRTWSGDPSAAICNLRGKGEVWHWLSFANYRSYSVHLELEGTIVSGDAGRATFVDKNSRGKETRGATWSKPYFLPKRPPGVLKGPSVQVNNFVRLEPKEPGGNERVHTKVIAILRHGRRQTFDLDIIVDV